MPSYVRKLCQGGVALVPIMILLSVMPSCGGNAGLDGAGGSATGGQASGGESSESGGAESGGTGSGGTGSGGTGSGGQSTTGGSSTGGGAEAGGSSSGGGGPAGGAAGAAGSGGGGSGGTTGHPDCLLPLETGPCDGALTHFGFDAERGVCRPFSYGGCEGNENNFETLAECDAACRDGEPTPTDSCDLPTNCALEFAACCGVCEPASLDQYQAVSSDFASAVRAERDQSCSMIDCGACAPGESVSQNFASVCEDKHCVAIDVRERDELSACEQDTDCHLRLGLGCCEGCAGDDDWVAVNGGTGVFDTLCGGVAIPCPACAVEEPLDLVARCVEGTCQAVSL